jgi:hypothetical protein
MHPAAPPGWYPDPQGVQRFRWFDGAQWSAHVSAVSEPEGQHPDSVTHWMVPTGRSWQSITAGYLGLFSIVIVFLGPFAIWAGIAGLMAAKKAGTHGRGRSVFGIVAGVWGTAILVVLVVRLAVGG